jgi:glycosyltransferase involved in cell wall biosynthesis
MAWVKNQAGLVLALRILRRRGVLPAGTVVLLPGRVRDRSHAWLVAGLAGPLARAGIIRQPGDIGDLAPYYHAADLLVLPSLAEGMPNVVLEAQLCGLPAIVTQQANRDAIVLDGQTGWVVGTGNPWALARAIEEAAVLLALQRRHMGDAGRARVLAHFGAEVALDRLQRLYAEALGLADEPAAAAAI